MRWNISIYDVARISISVQLKKDSMRVAIIKKIVLICVPFILKTDLVLAGCCTKKVEKDLSQPS